jgi:hypothetical protein
MSREKVEVVRAALVAYSRGYEAMLKHAAPDCELAWSPATSVYGRSGLAVQHRGEL